MAFQNPSTSLTIPAGKETGRRIVIDGDTGEILGYDDNDRIIFIIEMDTPSVEMADPDTGSTITTAVGGDGVCRLLLQPQDQVGHTYTPGVLLAGEFPGPNFGPVTTLSAPTIDGLPTSRLVLVGENGGGPATIDLRSTGTGSRVQVLDGMELQGGEPFIYLVTDQGFAILSTTFQDVVGMSVPLQANGFYILQFSMLYTVSAAGQFKFQFTAPAGAIFANHQFIGYNAAGTLVYGPTVANGGVAGLRGTGGLDAVSSSGLIFTGANAGTLQLQVAKTVAAGGDSPLVRAGSFFRIKRFA